MQFSLMFFASDENALTGNKYELVIESAKFADQHGFQSVWLPERHFTQLGCLYPNPAVLQAALARETRHIRLQAGSVVLPLHHPLRVAEEWAMVDNLSGGRVGVSFASGWNPDDFALAPERYKQRFERMLTDMEQVRRLWRGEALPVINGVGEQTQVRIYPTPVQPELPVWMTAASNPATFSKAGELGVNLLTHLLDQGVEKLASQIQLYREARAKAGHDPETGRVSLMMHTFVGQDPQVAREQARVPYCTYLKANLGLLKGLAQSRDRGVDISSLSDKELDEFVNFLYDRFVSTRAFIGSPETCLELAGQLRDAGVDEVAALLDFGPPPELVLKNLPYLHALKEQAQALGPRVRREQEPSVRPAPIPAAPEAAPGPVPVALIQERCSREVEGAAFYAEVAESGAEYGPTMRSLERVWRGEGEALGRLRLPPGLEGQEEGFGFHPVLLDSCFLLLGALAPERPGAGRLVALPTGMREFRIHASPRGVLFSHVVRTSAPGDNLLTGDVRIVDEAGVLLAEASGLRIQLVEQQARPSAADAVDALLYGLEWQPQPIEPEEVPPPGHWWILMDGQGVGQALAERLLARGDSVTRIFPGEKLQALGEHTYELVPGDAAQARALVERLRDEGAAMPRGVVHLWALDSRDAEETTLASLEQDQERGLFSALGWIQALVGVGGVKPPRLWLVTRGSQAIGTETSVPGVAQATLWGLGRVLGAEHPELWGGLVDLEAGLPAAACAAQLLPVLHHPGREDQHVLRGGQRHVARLVRRQGLPRGGAAARFRKDGTYLLTGGLGDIGLVIARWMVERGARQVVLLGRTRLPPRAEWTQVAPGSRLASQVAAVEALERLGARVLPASVDVADEAQVSALLRVLQEEGWPPVRGVLHSAGVIQGGTLMSLDAAAFRTVLRPKVTGGWVLHRLLAEAPLDFFVLISAIPGLVGWIGSGAANYSAANTFLDSLAFHRRARSQPGLTLDYGPWSEVGLAVREGGLPLLARQGIGSMTPEQGLEALDRSFSQSGTQLAIASLDWARFFQAFPHATGSPLLTSLASEVAASAQASDAARPGAMQQSLREAPPEQRVRLLQEYLTGQVARVLAQASSRLDVHQSLASMGLDSLMSIELRNRLESELGVVIPMVNLLRGPSIAQLADDVLPTMNLSAPVSAPGNNTEMEEITL